MESPGLRGPGRGLFLPEPRLLETCASTRSPGRNCLESLPMLLSGLVRDHAWVDTAELRWLRAGAREAGPGRRCRRRSGGSESLLRSFDVITHMDTSHAPPPTE